MPIKLIEGDLFQTKAEIICHGVNCQGSFKSGFAGEIAKRWPRVRSAYLDRYQNRGFKLGDVQWVYSSVEHYKLQFPIVANMATQEFYGYDEKVYVDYKAVGICMERVLGYANAMGYAVAMPKVGCGLANGDWDVVYEIIYNLSLKFPSVELEIYSL